MSTPFDPPTPSSHPTGGDGADDEATLAASWKSGSRPVSRCELLESVAAELALGSLAGAERSAALAHLDDCPPCRQLVEELTAASDQLLLIAAEADPPAGFEVRLLERLKAQTATLPAAAVAGPAQPGIRGLASATPSAGAARLGAPGSLEIQRSRRPRRFTARARAAMSVAALALAGAGVGLGMEVAPRAALPVSAFGQLRVTSLHAGSGTTAPRAAPAGEVVITAGRPSWVLMSVDLRATGWVKCEVVVGGRTALVGTFELYHGKGSWASVLKQPGGAVTSARVVSPSGRVLASASFQT